jgi:hypothetical protein
VALNRRPDYQQVRRYINDIEPLFMEYARYYLGQQGAEDWEAQVRELAGTIKERNLPMALRGRNTDAIALMRHLQAQDLYDPVLDGLVSAFKYDKTYFDKIVSSVGPLMKKLTTGNIAELISPNYLDEKDRRPIFEWMDVISRKGIVYVGLDALTDTTVASAVGNSMFADLVSVTGQLYKHGVPGETSGKPPTISMHADEFNELIGDEFIPLLNKAGGAGFDVRRPWRTPSGRAVRVLFLSRRNGQVTAYTQTWSDVEARIGNRERTLLYQLVEQYYPAFIDQLTAQGTVLPCYVQREFEEVAPCQGSRQRTRGISAKPVAQPPVPALRLLLFATDLLAESNDLG